MDAADIVDVVREFVTLRRAGVNYKGLCPFHDERTPSFVVSPAKQLCKCFSCGKGGNVVHFIMEHEQMTYPEAIKWLGRKYGIEIKEKELTPEERQAQTARESMFVLNEWARDYFARALRNTPDGTAYGMAYLRQRGFRDDIIEKFQLGYSPQERQAVGKAALARGFSETCIERTGLCYRTDDGKLFDRYHGRVIFPVHTVSGKVVAFGGRILTADKKKAKYVNSPESEIYSKSHELYGLYLAKHAIVKHGRCYLVEGYTDVISMHQCGIENVVASSGTSLTSGQIRLLHRFTENITILYDGDSAGIKASLRGIDMLLAEGLNIKVLLLPDGDDPDSFARKHTAADFTAYIEANQVDFIRFKTNLLLQDAAGDPLARAQLVQSVVESVAVIPNAIVRQMYAHETADLLTVDEGLLVNEVAKLRRKRREDERTATKPSAPESAEQAADEAAERAAERYAQQEGSAAASSAPHETPRPQQGSALLMPAATGAEREERELIAAVVRYGAMPLTVGEGEEAETMTVAQFVADDLEADDLHLATPLYARILSEACEALRVDGCAALPYFLAHPDPEVSALAAQLGEDRYVLCQTQLQGFVPDEERLGDLIPRLLHDLKSRLVVTQMRDVLQRLRDPAIAADREAQLALMNRYKALAEIERAFARVLGDRIVTV